MILLFLKTLKVRTTFTIEQVRSIFSAHISGERTNSEIEKLSREKWEAVIKLINDEVSIRLEQKKLTYFERRGLGTILNGQIEAMEDGTIIKAYVGLTRTWAWYLGIILAFTAAFFLIALSKKISDAMIVSSIIFVMWYTVAIIAFNVQVKVHRRIINEMFADPKYHFYHLS